MKTFSLFLVCSVLSLTGWPALGERYVTLAGLGDSVLVPKGETALVVYASGATQMLYQKGTATPVRLTIADNSINDISALPLVGPATLTCRTADAVIGMRVVPTSTPTEDALTTIPSTAVVIPADGAGGGAEVLLESSPDMVTWTPALPGTYAADSNCRFFRVRVLRSP